MRKRLLPQGSRGMAVLLALAVVTAGCAGGAPQRWNKAGVDDDERQRDVAGCRRYAEERAGRDYSTALGGIEAGQSGLAGGTALQRDFARIDAKRYADRLFESCLMQRGYHPVEAGSDRR